jgi:hypothetical protein
MANKSWLDVVMAVLQDDLENHNSFCVVEENLFFCFDLKERKMREEKRKINKRNHKAFFLLCDLISFQLVAS